MDNDLDKKNHKTKVIKVKKKSNFYVCNYPMITNSQVNNNNHYLINSNLDFSRNNQNQFNNLNSK